MIQNVAPAFFLITEHDIFQLQREISRHSLVLQIHVLPLCHSIALQDACLDEAIGQHRGDEAIKDDGADDPHHQHDGQHGNRDLAVAADEQGPAPDQTG